MQNEIKTRIAKLWLAEDGVLHYRYDAGTEATLDDAKEEVAAAVQLSKGIRRPTLVDLRYMKSASRDARKYYASDDAARAEKVAALLIGSPVSRVIGNFYMAIAKPKIQTRLFTSEGEAIEWLKQFREPLP